MCALAVLLACLTCPCHTLKVPIKNERLQQHLENVDLRKADDAMSIPESTGLKLLTNFLFSLNPSAAFHSLGWADGIRTGLSYRNIPSIFMKRRISLDFPAPADKAYKLQNPEQMFFSQWSQEQLLFSDILAPITKSYSGQQSRPFFVESGARDGEEHSNTLFLERAMGWTGLLIEPSNIEYPSLLKKNRKCYCWHGCLSETGKSEDVQFLDTGDGLSQISKEGQDTVKAEPLLSLLQEIDKESSAHTVDFWSLDIEGSEGPVLENTDFQAVEFGVLMIEMNKGRENNERIRRVMEANNFVDVGGTKYDGGVLDYVFVNPKYFEARGIPVPQCVVGLTPPQLSPQQKRDR